MTKTTGAQPQGVWRIFQQDLSALSRWVQAGLTSLTNWLFAFNQEGARRRMNLFIAITVILWLGLALLAHPVRAGRDPALIQLITALFSADVLRHIVVLALALWVGLRLAAIYLDDIFELSNVSIAEHFIREAVFPAQYKQITIKDGDISLLDLDSPVVKIGGPGLVNVHLENVALFEKIDGTPHIIKPTRTRIEPLDGFERLRAVIDLRDQVLELDVVKGRTQDGIPVYAKDVRLVFSIYRGDMDQWEGETFEQPYPFDDNAVEALVYQQGKGLWSNAMRYLITGELREFIASHTLSEFLTNAHADNNGITFVPRDQITNLFYDFTLGFSTRAAERGVQLEWIGVGTWVTPSEIIPTRHLEAWKLSCETRAKRNPVRLEKIRIDARVSEHLQNIDELLTTFYTLQQDEGNVTDEMVMRRLLLNYREKLLRAREYYQAENLPPNPEVEEAIRHISIVASIKPGKKPGGS